MFVVAYAARRPDAEDPTAALATLASGRSKTEPLSEMTVRVTAHLAHNQKNSGRLWVEFP